MEIRISHSFPCAPRAYWDLAWDPELEREIRAAAEVDFTVLEERVEGARAFSRTRVAPRRELPLVAQKALGQARLSYVQEIDQDNDALTTRWRVVPDVLTEKVRCQGSSRVVPSAGGCERIIEGAIDVSIPLVGGAVERVILGEIERSYERAAEVIRRRLPAE